jgi:purine nucleosidase
MTTVPNPNDLPSVPENRRWRYGSFPWLDASPRLEGRPRVIIDNDFSGDPDDLYQLVHHLLVPTVEIRGVIASHLRPGDPLDPGPDTAANAARVAEGVFARMGLLSNELIVAGSPEALVDERTPIKSAATDVIIREALRDDAGSRLFYAAGGGLTDLASAILLEPAVAERVTVVWIGGEEHAGFALPAPGAMPIEYNLLIDVVAGRVVFDSGTEIWQVPRDVYRQCLVSDAELRSRVRDAGELGRYLYDETYAVMEANQEGPSATYALGDSPLVLLTALRSTFDPDTSSSRYELRPTPALTADGAYRQVAGRPLMRIYTQVDVRLMFEDMYLRLQEFCRWQHG